MKPLAFALFIFSLFRSQSGSSRRPPGAGRWSFRRCI